MHQPAEIPRPPQPIRTLTVVTLVVLLAVPVTSPPAAAQVAPDSFPPDLLWFGTGTALAAALVLDEVVRTEVVAEDGQLHSLSHVGDLLGRGGMMAAGLGGVYGIATLTGDDELAGSAGRILLALAAAGIVNGSLKFGVGRLRPREGGGPFEFRPLNLDNDWQSFPSGHTVTAFAVATAVSEEADSPWVTGLVYGAATLTAWSRVHEDGHWTSDVVAGAIVGTLTSRLTLRWLEARSERRRAGHAGPRVALSPLGMSVTLPVP